MSTNNSSQKMVGNTQKKIKTFSNSIAVGSTITFLLSFLIRYLMLCGNLIMRIQYDDMGMLVYPAFLSGYKWGEIASYCDYYGGGYYILYTPLLKFIDSPTLIWELIIFGHILLISLGCAVSYYAAVRYLNFKKSFLTVVQCIGSSVIIVTYSSMSNEPMLFLLTWLIDLVLMSWEKENKQSRKVFKVIVLVLLSGYSLTVHTRALVFAVAIVLVIIKKTIEQKKINAIISILTFLILFTVAYFLWNYAKGIVTGNLYMKGEAKVNNTSLIVGSAPFSKLFSINGIRAIIDILFGNIWMIASQTGGIIYFSVILAFIYLIRFMKKQSKGDGGDISFWFSLLCFLLGLGGLAVTYARYTMDSYSELSSMYESKGFFYLRYYSTFCGPLILTTLGGIVREEKDRKKTGIISLAMASFVFFYLICVVFPVLGGVENINGGSMHYISSDMNTGYANYKIAFILQIIVIALLCFSKKKYIAELLIIFMFVKPWFLINNGLVINVCLNDKADASLNYYNEYRDEWLADVDGYYVPTATLGRVYQYYLKKETIHVGYPENEGNWVVFTNSPDDSNLQKLGYSALYLDSNEYIWTKEMKNK